VERHALGQKTGNDRIAADDGGVRGAPRAVCNAIVVGDTRFERADAFRDVVNRDGQMLVSVSLSLVMPEKAGPDACPCATRVFSSIKQDPARALGAWPRALDIISVRIVCFGI
jgi:hypothetical protein